MKPCPYCAESIQDLAIKCRYCGEVVASAPVALRAAAYPSYEYRSQATLFGWPLLHVTKGVNPATGRPQVARGVIAVGDVAVGLVAFGGLAAGGIAFGGLSLGMLAIGGLAVGGVAAGGAAFGWYWAVGGLAVSLGYAIGGAALAPHTVSAAGADPEVIRALERALARFGLHLPR